MLRGLMLLALPALLSCSNVLGYDNLSFEDAGPSGTGGASTGGASTGGASTGGASTGGASTGGASTGGASTGGASTGGASTGGASTGGASTGGASSGGTTGGDPFAAQRQACVDTINQLRATKSLQPLQRWTDGENCADLQATDDNKTGKAHGAWSSKKFGCDGGSGQNECLGGGITGCLNSMWNEKDKAGCAGCDQCTGPGGCTGCDFYGSQTGDVCGHYVNMSAKWFTKVACGFSSAGNWAVQNYK
jgi:hypothetical protein